MFCLPVEAKYPFFSLKLMEYIGGWRKFYTELVCFFIFFGDKKIAFPFDLFSHPFVIEFFWFALLQFKIEEKIRIKAFMLLMCLEVLRQGFFSSPVRDWEGVCRSL